MMTSYYFQLWKHGIVWNTNKLLFPPLKWYQDLIIHINNFLTICTVSLKELA